MGLSCGVARTPANAPARRTRGYDMRRVVARVCDDASVFELQPLYAQNVVTALGRIDGFVVYVDQAIANRIGDYME